MNIVGVVAMTAALVAFSASAQNASAQTDMTSRQARAIPDRSNIGHPTKEKKSVARRGGRAFASVPGARYRSAPIRSASSAFDGDWSVLILTERGACDRAYRYGVQISNGDVLNAGSEPISLV